MTLQDAVKEAQAANKTESTSGKNPAYYTKQKQSFIDEVFVSPEAQVRIHAAGSEHAPVGNLKRLLENETDMDVLSVLLMNSRIPSKSLETWSKTDAAEQFSENDEVYQHVLARLSSAAEEAGDEGEGEDEN